MHFGRRLLVPQEQIALAARPHWRELGRPIVLTAVIVALSIWALIAGVPTWAETALAVVIVLAMGWMLLRYLKWTSNWLILTDKRLISRRGVLMRRVMEIGLDQVTDVSYSQSILDRVLRCGDLTVAAAGDGEPVTFLHVSSVASAQREISSRRDAHVSGWSTRGWTDSRGRFAESSLDQSIPAQLRQLDDLRRRGVISKREFSAKKSELLSRM